MKDLMEQFLYVVATCPGLTDREITDRLLGRQARVQAVKHAAHLLEKKGKIRRHRRRDGLVGNFFEGESTIRPGAIPPSLREPGGPALNMTEEEVKRRIRKWLEDSGWVVRVIEGKPRDGGVEARRGDDRWIIEAKGSGSRNPVKNTYFLTVLGETLQKMDDPGARYSIALPDTAKFRKLWEKLPELAKSRMGITALFVGENGTVELAG